MGAVRTDQVACDSWLRAPRRNTRGASRRAVQNDSRIPAVTRNSRRRAVPRRGTARTATRRDRAAGRAALGKALRRA